MPYLQVFEHDVFISYAHIDNRPDREGELGWVEQFERALKLRLLKRFGREVDVWRDPELARSQRFDPVIEAAVRGSAIMLSLVSSSYLVSEYCRQEVAWFAAKAAAEPAGLSIDHHVRVFPLLLYNVPAAEWPEPCRATSGFRFHDAVEREFGKPLRPDHDDFTDQVCRVVEELHTVLIALERRATRSEPVREEPSPSRTIFLADVSDDIRRERRHLLAELQRSGIEVVRGIPPPEGRSAHETAVVEALARSRLSIHLLGSVPGRPLEEDTPHETYPLEQLRIGLEHARSQLVILPPGIERQDIEEPEYASLITSLEGRPREAERLEILHIDRMQIAEEVLAKLRWLDEQDASQRPSTGPVRAATAFVDLHVNDLAAAGDLVAHLQRHHIHAVTIPSADLDPAEGLSLFEDYLKSAGLFIVVFGSVVRSWVEQRLNEAFKLILSNRLTTRVGIYLAPPHKSSAEAAFPPLFQVMDNSDRFDPKTLDSLLEERDRELMNGDAQRSNPYVGLRPFEWTDSLYFFGRRSQVADLLQRLHETRFLAVVGSSGCGKSSLIRAGMVPALLGGFLLQDRARWLIATTKPGGGPVGNLALALCTMEGAEPKARDANQLAAAVHEDHAPAVLEHLRPRLGADANLLLLVDQFEEIFAFRGRELDEPLAEASRDERLERARRQREAAEFVGLLLSLAEQKELPVYVVLTMRSDFLGDCDLFYGLPEAMNQSRYLVPRLNRSQLRDAIEGPALLLRQRLAPRLVDTLLNELGDRSDRLPILEHALMRAWDVWQRRGGKGPIDLAHYEEAGTLREALPRHANEALGEEDLATTASLFKCLTDTDPNQRRVRRSASLGELAAVCGAGRDVVQAILDRFNADGRNFLLLSPQVDPEATRVEICHESLIRQWDQLARWVDEERDARDQLLDLVARARGGRALLRDPDLQIALDWRARVAPTAAWALRYSSDPSDLDAALDYLERSRLAKVEAANRRRRNRNLGVAAALGVGLLLSALTLSAFDNAARARDIACVALARQWMESDPTRAALLLLEVSRPERTGYAAQTMRESLGHRIAENVLRGHEGPVSIVVYSPDGTRIVTGSADGTARVFSADGTRPTLVLRGHQDWVTAAAFSPDGTRIVTASNDGTARVWAADGSHEPVVLRGHEGRVIAASFSANGRRILTGSEDGTARVWQADGSGEPAVLRGEEGPVLSATFSPDGSQIVTAFDDGTARVWRSDGSGEPLVLRGHQGSVTVARFSPDGTRIVTGAADGQARVWRSDGSGETVVHGERRSFGTVEVAAFSPDGKRIMTAYTDLSNRSMLEVWNADGTGEPVVLSHDSGPRRLGVLTTAAISPDGRWIVTASNDGIVRVFDLQVAGSSVVLHGHEAVVGTVAFSPDASRVVTGSSDGTARVWRMIPSPDSVVLRGHERRVGSAVFSPDGTQVVTASDDRTARVWRADGSGEPVVLRGHEGPILVASFSADGGRIVTGSDDGTARVWQADGSGEPVVLRGHTALVGSVAFSTDGSHIVTGSDDGTARVWRADGSGEPVVLRGHEGLVVSVAFSPDGTRVATASNDRTARVWNTDGSGEPVVFEGHEGAVGSVAFSPDGTRIVTASGDGTARVWHTDGSGEATILSQSAFIGMAAFSPDGRRIVTASTDGTVRVWRAEGVGKPIELRGHERWVGKAAFSPDGLQIVTASDDGTARVWNAEGSGEALVLRGHQDRLTTATFSPDGTRVLTASTDGTARVWTYRAQDLRQPIAAATQACLDARFRENHLDESQGQSRREFERCERRHGRLL